MWGNFNLDSDGSQLTYFISKHNCSPDPFAADQGLFWIQTWLVKALQWKQFFDVRSQHIKSPNTLLLRWVSERLGLTCEQLQTSEAWRERNTTGNFTWARCLVYIWRNEYTNGYTKGAFLSCHAWNCVLTLLKSSGSFSQKFVGSLWSFGGTEENPGLSTHHTHLQSLCQLEEWTPSCGHAGQGGWSQGPDTDDHRWPHMFLVTTTHPAGRSVEELLFLHEGKEERRVSLWRKLGGFPMASTTSKETKACVVNDNPRTYSAIMTCLPLRWIF